VDSLGSFGSTIGMLRSKVVVLAWVGLLVACTGTSESKAASKGESVPASSEPATPEPTSVPTPPVPVVPPAPATPEPTPVPTPPAPPPTPVIAPPETTRLPAFVGEPRLLIAGEEGLREFDLDGRLLNTLVPEPCEAPRVLPNGEILFLRTTPSQAYELVRRTAGGELRPVAILPYHYDEAKCELVDSECESCTTLDLQEAEQFAFDPSTGEVCLGLQDRNINMANVIVDVRVDLATGKVRHEILTSFCPPEQYRMAHCDRLWWRVAGPEDEAPVAEFPFDFVEDKAGESPGAIVKAGRKPITICSRANPELCAHETVGADARSRSGRFVLLDGIWSEGDYIHREQVIFDRSDGSLHTVERGEKDWRMVRVQPSEVMQPTDDWRRLDAVGESDVRWLPRDRLWIDGLLIDVAGKKVHALGGDLALRLDVWL
jgi:hypothetical protein